jgi:AcrR family transcriptional regulator
MVPIAITLVSMSNSLKSKIKQAVRIRRDPAHARAVILDAARTLLAERGPDAVGLKDVARQAGVSHALVSHYFGTYDALVEAALKAQAAEVERELLARIMSGGDGEGPEAWIEKFFEALAHPLYGKLAVWSILSGRVQRKDFFAHSDQGLRRVAEAIEARAAAGGLTLHGDHDDLEFALVLTLCASFGYLIGGALFWESLGRTPGPERDRWFRKKLAQALQAGPPRPAAASGGKSGQ